MGEIIQGIILNLLTLYAFPLHISTLYTEIKFKNFLICWIETEPRERESVKEGEKSYPRNFCSFWKNTEKDEKNVFHASNHFLSHSAQDFC